MSKDSFKSNFSSFINGNGVFITLWRALVYGLVFISIMGLVWEYGLAESRLTLIELRHLDVFVASIFSIDYLVRFYASSQRGKFVANIYNIFDLIAILPTFLAGIDGFQIMRGARIIRALRVLRFMRVISMVRSLDLKLSRDNNIKVSANPQIELYKQLLGFYMHLESLKMISKGKGGINGSNDGKQAVKQLSGMIASLNKKINEMASKLSHVDEDGVFIINFYELIRQISPVLGRLQKVYGGKKSIKLKTGALASSDVNSYIGENVMDFHKLHYLIREMGYLLNHEAELPKGEKIDELPSQSVSRHVYLLLLMKSSLRDVIATVTVAICINLFIQFMAWDSNLASAFEYISFVEGAMGTLIILITSFNMKYTNGKRHATDLEVIDFMNFLVYYAGRIRGMILNGEKLASKREQTLTEVNAYFDSLGLSIIHGMRSEKEYKFDTGSLQILERIKFIFSKYQAKVDSRTFDKYEEMHGNAGLKLNKFQVLSSMRMPVIFNELNHWLIRGTYFLLIVFSPLSAIPRIIVMNVLQRAFFRVSQETDSASVGNSLAGIPMEERILRRLCRIGAVLNIKR